MNYKLFLFSLSVFFLITSCEEDDHHHDDDCHECHVLCAMDDGTTHEHEIGEFCGDELADVSEFFDIEANISDNKSNLNNGFYSIKVKQNKRICVNV